MAGVDADDEARLLLDFLRHGGGRGVVDGVEVRRARKPILISRVQAKCDAKQHANRQQPFSDHVMELKIAVSTHAIIPSDLLSIAS